MTETLEKLVGIPVVSFVAFNGSTDYIWVTDDSWYTLLLNEPGGSAALSAYGL